MVFRDAIHGRTVVVLLLMHFLSFIFMAPWTTSLGGFFIECCLSGCPQCSATRGTRHRSLFVWWCAPPPSYERGGESNRIPVGNDWLRKHQSMDAVIKLSTYLILLMLFIAREGFNLKLEGQWRLTVEEGLPCYCVNTEPIKEGRRSS